ncbi:hypothetical protein RR48_00712 [Papilio machaon]|uniref:FLYWCH-type domain-containing protein n=1 Tax=Papilio machaon TaxID=76193 RepID=A0A0N1PJP8_PAPMA|nr:hypothetical protein RR48_00712 [Papilio machaon]
MFLFTETPEFIFGSRGNRILRLGKYYYSVHVCATLDNGIVKTRWYCRTQHSRGCKAVIHTLDDVIVSCKTTHNHA